MTSYDETVRISDAETFCFFSERISIFFAGYFSPLHLVNIGELGAGQLTSGEVTP
jgi:hypothetical protein